jgi:uncharacterized protein with HEPN domain
MSRRGDPERLADIREAIDRIVAYVGGMSYEEFAIDTKTQDAVIRNIEIIGEAVKSVSEQLRAANPQVPWRSLAGMRDRLIHQYFGVNLDVVWQAVSYDLPGVGLSIARL